MDRRMSERFLVIGATSFYGRNFCALVRSRGGEVTEHRLGDPLPQEAFHYIVNFAAKSLVAESWDDPGEWMRVNGEVTTRFFDQIRKMIFRKYIHVSTPEVYGSTPDWVTEDAPFNPSTPYAVSRAAGDMMLKAFGKAYGIPYIITRTANIYGPGQQDFKVIPKAIACKKKREVFKLHGGGFSTRDFIHVRDACEATYLLCTNGSTGETYHISQGKVLSILSLIKMIGCKYQDVGGRLGNDASYRMFNLKLRGLGWSAKINLKEGLEECMSAA